MPITFTLQSLETLNLIYHISCYRNKHAQWAKSPKAVYRSVFLTM